MIFSALAFRRIGIGIASTVARCSHVFPDSSGSRSTNSRSFRLCSIRISHWAIPEVTIRTVRCLSTEVVRYYFTFLFFPSKIQNIFENFGTFWQLKNLEFFVEKFWKWLKKFENFEKMLIFSKLLKICNFWMDHFYHFFFYMRLWPFGILCSLYIIFRVFVRQNKWRNASGGWCASCVFAKGLQKIRNW